MQDSASCHTAAATTNYLRENNVDVYEYWPSNSPDLNPIENVWAYIEHKLKKRVCTSDNELYEQIERVWNADNSVTPGATYFFGIGTTSILIW